MIENEAVLVALIGGVSTLVGVFLKGLWDMYRGRHENEKRLEKDRRDSVSIYKAEALEAHERATREWEKARMYSLYAHTVQLYCIREHETDPRDFPPWPNGKMG